MCVFQIHSTQLLNYSHWNELALVRELFLETLYNANFYRVVELACEMPYPFI